MEAEGEEMKERSKVTWRPNIYQQMPVHDVDTSVELEYGDGLGVGDALDPVFCPPTDGDGVGDPKPCPPLDDKDDVEAEPCSCELAPLLLLFLDPATPPTTATVIMTSTAIAIMMNPFLVV